jgi:NtrC-family two-component system sensor histidine kinase KinB
LLAWGPGSPGPIEPQIGRRAFEAGLVQHIPDVRMDTSGVASHQDARSSLAIPLTRGQRAIGVLIVESELAHAFDDDDRQLAESLAEAISLAWSNADLFQATVNEQQRLLTLIQSSRDGILFVDMDGRVLVVNEAALTLLSLPEQPHEWDGRPLVEVIQALRCHAPALARVAVAEVRRMQEGSEPLGEGECEVPPRFIRWLNLPVLADDLLLGRLLVLHDTTQERLLGRMRDDLTHTMVHDLRNPLTALSMALHYLGDPQSGDLATQQRVMLDYAVGSLRKMLKLVNNILEVSRLEGGQVPLACAPVSMDSLIRDAVNGQSLLAAQKGLRVRTDSSPALPPVWADTSLLDRVLQNLIGNAVKFTPSGGQIQVSARVVADGEEIEISVRDTGPGIPPELQARLFQKFVTGQQEESGSGLGLVFCRLVVEAHKGRIWVESEPGTGAAFTFALPVAHAHISVVEAVTA